MWKANVIRTVLESVSVRQGDVKVFGHFECNLSDGILSCMLPFMGGVTFVLFPLALQEYPRIC